MAAKKRIKKQSLLEFRAWLEGVEELQPDGWAPNANQWRLIRDKIDGIKETIIEKVVEHPNAPAPAPNNPYGGQPAIPSQSQLMPAPPVAGGVPTGPVSMGNDAQKMFNPAGGKTKTPDIDTSDGNVASGFA